MSEEATRANGLEPDAAKAEAVRGALIPWFEENGRDLPWRRTRDPWRVLVSEVMLQQIQVKRAVPFYERFLARFPTVEALAEAPLADAIRVWGDLGRYRRVVNLHRTARLILEEHGGRVPSDPEALLKLPGVGPYTAGAVACFAFERDAPFLDTNVRSTDDGAPAIGKTLQPDARASCRYHLARSSHRHYSTCGPHLASLARCDVRVPKA